MKCRSVACIWSGGRAPAQRVTAAAALLHPPTLYTGGSDGSIIQWNLLSPSSSDGDSTSEIKPVAMLCGHAAAIADLATCYPVAASSGGEDSRIENFSNGAMCSVSNTHGSLISACTDGVLCVWSRGSGHCRRRRKLPPWVGSPSVIRTLPISPRYVCIGCCPVDATHLSACDSIEGGDTLGDKEHQHRKAPKCTVVIVDTYSLTIVQTVFHGNLSIGPLKFLDVVWLGEDGEKHSVLMADSFGRVQLVPILKDSNLDGQGGNGIQKGSQLEVAVWGNHLSEGGQFMSIATCANIVALVLRDCCIFRLLTSGTTIGEIYLLDNLPVVESSTQSHVITGMFLKNGEGGEVHEIEEAYESFQGNFAVWNSAGSAIVYEISYLNDKFNHEVLCEISPTSYPIYEMITVFFIQMEDNLLRIESICSNAEEPLQWKPHVTIWSMYQKQDNHGKSCQQFALMLGQSDSSVDWISSSHLLCEINNQDGQERRITSAQSSTPNLENVHANNGSYSFVHNGGTVSSSMVISENLFVPYAVVYGFFTGEIEVVHFDMFDTFSRSPRHNVASRVSRQCFSGHTGAILCLAAHQMLGSSEAQNFSLVLVSGSMDCTVRIWDLDSGNLIRVMHQHVAPVHQIIFPPAHTERPWSDCFLSVGDDSCVALTSLETLRVERMFPGHPSNPQKVVWDGARGYVACLCQSHSGTSDPVDVLYIWDVKTGARERVLRGTASHSMLDHFCKGIILNGNTSLSSLRLPIIEDGSFPQGHINFLDKRVTLANIMEPATSRAQVKQGDLVKLFPGTSYFLLSNRHPIRWTCPFPGIAALSFDLGSLMFSCQNHESEANGSSKQENINMKQQGTNSPKPHCVTIGNGSDNSRMSIENREEGDWIRSLEEYLLRFSLSFLHLWNIDCELDKLLITDMKLKRPENFILTSGLPGDKGSLTLTFPCLDSALELWKSSSEFSAMRSLTMVSIAQRMISLSHSTATASSALAAFYTRHFADKFQDIKPPLLQLLVSFWQDESEHVRMAARTLFHCAASKAIPLALCSEKADNHVKLLRSLSGIGENEDEVSEVEGTSLASNVSTDTQGVSQAQEYSDKSPGEQGITAEEESKILAWLESFEMPDWISCVGGTSQDAMTSHIIVAAALAIWYPSLVKPSLAMLVVHPLVKLVMAMNEKYSSTAAELLAEGMDSTWKACIASEIPRLIGDIFFQIECVSGTNSSGNHPAVLSSIQQTLVGVLLPSLAMADILGFLTVIESQIWSTASDSPVHLASLAILLRVMRASPRYLAQHLDKVVNFVLHTMDPGNTVMRKTCLHSSMTALKEVVRVFPMVALNDTSTKLAVGDAIGEISNASISVYDMQSVSKIKILDASGPPGLPSLLSGAGETGVTTVISALSFSPSGEGLIAFSEHGLMIRWWSLGSAWWEKLSRNLVPVQCTKLIFVPPWEGFSPNTSRSSIMASIMGHERQANLQENARGLSSTDSLKLLIHNLDLSYRLEWVGEHKVLLTRHGVELGTFPL